MIFRRGFIKIVIQFSVVITFFDVHIRLSTKSLDYYYYYVAMYFYVCLCMFIDDLKFINEDSYQSLTENADMHLANDHTAGTRFLYMCVCVYVYMYVYVCVYVRMYVYVYVHYTHTNPYMHIITCAHTNITQIHEKTC